MSKLWWASAGLTWWILLRLQVWHSLLTIIKTMMIGLCTHHQNSVYQQTYSRTSHFKIWNMPHYKHVRGSNSDQLTVPQHLDEAHCLSITSLCAYREEWNSPIMFNFGIWDPGMEIISFEKWDQLIFLLLQNHYWSLGSEIIYYKECLMLYFACYDCFSIIS